MSAELFLNFQERVVSGSHKQTTHYLNWQSNCKAVSNHYTKYRKFAEEGCFSESGKFSPDPGFSESSFVCD